MPKKSKKSETICVKITTGESQLEFNIARDALGKQLFEQVVRTVGLREVWYFGMKYLDKNGKSVWLRLDKKMSSNKFSPDAKNEFFLKVKFFPENAEKELIQSVTIRHLYLQVKNDILNATIECPTEKCIHLAAYACVAKFGPYTLQSCPARLPIDRLIQHRENLNLSDEEYFQRIISVYKEYNELSREDAMVNYLKLAQDLETYGFDSYLIQDKSGTSRKLRVDAHGLKVSSVKHDSEPEVDWPWSEVKSISFHDKKFVINPVNQSTKELTFLVEKTRIGKEIRSLCIGNHDLYFRRRRPDSIEMQQMRLQAREEREVREEERQLLKEERWRRMEYEKKLEELASLLSKKEEECSMMSKKLLKLETKLKDSCAKEQNKESSSQKDKKNTKEDIPRNGYSHKTNQLSQDKEQSYTKKSESSKKEKNRIKSENGISGNDNNILASSLTNGYANGTSTKTKSRY